eukprot:CAMPEP_0174340362 /NCGR_PEP_ID=MMETSP0810-20121108/24620_1 /TAXON_ID=73025 ORGANISM="Eutreptiella gymnastica-like, Strain CCMP1594" /NCGR_SAMPLE_ID=MMETSP0810 /ASSEMBLY_ACC=CAM_ASM_000659 /LENGTH=95 /DNA_ID=CAMNT_0015461491 /DNA_START=138 /DNA_END=426 /DNA_ORIENTATION=-
MTVSGRALGFADLAGGSRRGPMTALAWAGGTPARGSCGKNCRCLAQGQVRTHCAAQPPGKVIVGGQAPLRLQGALEAQHQKRSAESRVLHVMLLQ